MRHHRLNALVSALMPALLPALTPALLLAGCASTPHTPNAPSVTVREVHMALPASVAEVAEESFGKAAWDRRGEFLLTGQLVSYERSAERLSLFESLKSASGALSYSWATSNGVSIADCVGRPAAAPAGGAGPQPWALNCNWSGASDASLQIGAGEVRDGLLTRQGSYRRGELTLGLRSAHRLEGEAAPRATAVGYELLHEGLVVGSLELGRGLPKLRRPDPATPLGRAVTEAALVLALASEPAG